MTLSDDLLHRIFDFLCDRDFNIDRSAWKSFCRDHQISEDELSIRNQELLVELRSLSEDEAQRKKLEQVFCCNPFDVHVGNELRNLWHRKSESQLEPFREWAYGLTVHLLELGENVETSTAESKLSNSFQETVVIPAPAESSTTASTVKPPVKLSSAKGRLWLLMLLLGVGFGMGRLFMGNWNGNNQIFSGNANRATNRVVMPNFPLKSCGDVNPGGVNTWYPVFVNYSKADLFLIRRDYCGDAFRSRRKDTGAMAIQVSSFTSRERADAFAEVMRDRVGNAEVGEPTVR